MMKKVFILICVLTGVLNFLGCEKHTPDQSDSDKLQVVTTLFPLYDFSRQIAGDKADISLLLPPGVEAHSFEPKPGDIIKINKGDIFIYTGPFMEPWVADVLAGVINKELVVVDASQGIELTAKDKHKEHAAKEEGEEEHHHHNGVDPHIWVDPVLAQRIVNTIAAGFVQKDPANKDFYLANAAAYNAKLAALDSDIRQMLNGCKNKTIIYGGHFAFGYFARRYGLEHLSPYVGFAPDAEPTPRKLAEMIETMKLLGCSYIFYEELLEPRVAKVIAESTGAKLLLLHGAHNVSRDEIEKGVTYIEIMRGNLERLKLGLGCQTTAK